MFFLTYSPYLMSEYMEQLIMRIIRIIRLKEVLHLTGLARSTVYKYISEEKFPKPVPLGARVVGWVEEEVEEWVLARIEERDLGAEVLTIASP